LSDEIIAVDKTCPNLAEYLGSKISEAAHQLNFSAPPDPLSQYNTSCKLWQKETAWIIGKRG
jgi:hypothetical protein